MYAAQDDPLSCAIHDNKLLIPTSSQGSAGDNCRHTSISRYKPCLIFLQVFWRLAAS